MKLKYVLPFLAFALLCAPVRAQDWKIYPFLPSAESLISFPVDEGHHPAEPVEWWYTTGHVVGETTGNHYSYMLTYFYYPQSGFEGFRILNFSNDDTGAFYPQTSLVNYTTLATDHLEIGANIFLGGHDSWVTKKNGSDLIPYEYTINATGSSGALTLDYAALKNPLILEGDGFFEQGGGSNYTYYYSQTKNEVSGSITLNGITENVTGTSWIDRQYGSFNPYNSEDYEWMSINLSNGMDINLWNLFTAQGEIPDGLKYKFMAVYKNEDTQYTISDFDLERLEYKFTDDDARCYAQKWRLTSATDNIDITITTLHHNAEVSLPIRFYEGTTTITGTVDGVAVTGEGFAELLHHYTNPELNVTSPSTDSWDSSTAITWEVTNPDDGRPLTYDLEYSTDNQVTFNTIATGITTTSYLWENSSASVENGAEIWFKVTGNSKDKTLGGEAISNTRATVLATDDFQVRDISIYPNPAINNFTINLKTGSILPLKYEVFDLAGKVLKHNEITPTNKKIDVEVSDLQSGLYFVKVVSAGKEFISKLLIK